LKAKLEKVEIQNQRLLEESHEVQRLRRLLNFKDSNSANINLIGCEIIGRSPSNWYKTVKIDKGTSDGIGVNMVAITPDGLVGRVVTVAQTTAQILLITDREGAVGVVLQDSRTPGIVEGQGNNGALYMTHIPYYSNVNKGEKVVTSQLSEIYPPGILIGKITKITSDPNGLDKTGTVNPAVNFDKLEEIFIVQRFNTPVQQ
jgi:rod shape-determining protein MreC